MARTYIQPGEVVTKTAPVGGVTSGTPVLIGSLFGVPQTDADYGAEFELLVVGVHELAKTSAQAWTEGQKIYWDNGNSRCDSDSTVGQLIGVADQVAANPSSTGKVRLNGVAPATAEGPQGAIAALTDSSGYDGTHDDTVAAMAAPVDLTDSTGLDGTHDDELAALNGITDYTPHSSGSTPVTSNAATDLDTVAAALETARDEIEADFAVVAQNMSDVGQKVKELVAAEAVHAQNISDVVQKILEIRTALIAAGILSS